MTTADVDIVGLRGASRVFGRRRALSAITVAFKAGEIAALLGPNGAGKTTLLSLLASLARPTAGAVTYGAATGGPAAGVRAHVGWLGHDVGLYPELTARQNLEFFARLQGVSEDGIPAALARAGLDGRESERVAGFSRGMKQRLAVERALLHEPRLVLLDEPFTGLDRQASVALAARLAGLRATGRIVVVATHDLDAVDGLCDRVIVLKDGRLVADERARPPLREQYASWLAAGAGVDRA